MRLTLTILLIVLHFSASTQDLIVLFDSNEEGVSCYRIPAIVKAMNDDLIVAVDERVPSCGDLRGNRDINIVIRRSSDNGITWSHKETIVDFPEGESASDPSFILDLETGKIFLFYNYMDLIKKPNIYSFQYVVSDDHGNTWSEPTDITSQVSAKNTANDFKFITSGRGTQDKKGLMLHTIVNLEQGVSIFGSEDHGASWKPYGKSVKPGDESKIVLLEDGTWMVNSRVSQVGYRWIHLSRDEGITWESKPDSSLVDPACNAALLQYGGDTLYLSNINHKDMRKNLVIRKSIDGGHSWTIQDTIYKGSAAYSDLVVLGNGQLGLVYEKDDYREIVFHRYAPRP